MPTATMQHREKQEGASLIETLVLTILILIFIFITINRVWELRITAERTSVESLLGTIRSSMGIELSKNVLRKSNPKGLSQYNHSNPMAFLDPQSIPSNYLGDYRTQPDEPVPGEWYFNEQEATLNYRPLFPKYIEISDTSDPTLLRFQVQFSYDDINHNGHFDPGIDSAISINLVSLQSYRWKSDRS
jgi:hypothetical protein